jgi:hypothetical protein
VHEPAHQRRGAAPAAGTAQPSQLGVGIPTGRLGLPKGDQLGRLRLVAFVDGGDEREAQPVAGRDGRQRPLLLALDPDGRRGGAGRPWQAKGTGR